ncbi:MAG TPA: patatin-like phospholipase family protein [Pyrinomonadaceae bacterium]|nr:patatin-like phospholipase family protein [Pyrinomonadaceae bacterium]
MSDQSDQSDHPLRIYNVLEEEYELLHGAPSPSVDPDKPAEARLKNIIKENHKENLAAICLSGGGIRSATFGLGVLQGLAHNDLLQKFAYVSTVSGGGYIGSWLSAWIHREEKGLKVVAEQLPGEHPPYVMRPEAEPITHLRAYSNYLTPKLGLLSADTWTLVAMVIRNLILNWLVLIPLLIAVLALPRLFVSFAQLTPPSYVRVGALLLGVIFGVTMIVYVAISRPTITKKNRDQTSFFTWCFGPMLLSATLLALYWCWFAHSNVDLEKRLTFHLLDGRPILGFIAFAVLLHLAAFVVYAPLIIRAIKRGLLVREFISLLFNGIAGGAMLFLATRFLPELKTLDFKELSLYSTLAVPIYLLVVFLGLSLFVGLASKWTEDEDREWWARYGAWILIAGVVWLVGSFLVLIAPELTSFVVKKYVVPAGGLLGVITALLARSAKLPAKGEKPKGWMALLTQHGLTLGAIVFAAILVVSLSIATYSLINWLATVWTWIGVELAERTGLRPFAASGLAPTRDILLFMGAAAGIGLLMAHYVNTNKFSHHAMYRNRLIRAYLGASRRSAERQPNKFTGFDSDDNVNMAELRPETLHTKSFTEPNGFRSLVNRLREKSDPASAYIESKALEFATKQLLKRYDPNRAGDHSGKALESALIRDLNKHLLQNPIVPPDIQKALAIDLESVSAPSVEFVKRNRLALEAVFKEEIRPANLSSRRPLHIINMTLNLVGGDRLAWQQRKAESFTVSPLHCGSFQIPDSDERTGPVYGSYRRTVKYGGETYGGISLGTAMAISGAAASPNMGYYSSPVVGFLMTLFNVRMGWWLGNPGPAGKDYYKFSSPKSAVYPIIAEALGWTDDQNNYVYLSDGGHFENLGLYEMVLRRCRLIVVSDAAGDPDFHYNDLGNAVQKVRTDLGIPIEFGPMKIFPRRDKKPGAYCAIGTIQYSCIDKGEPDGKIIYIKPAFYGDEPRDIYRYAMTHETFPQQSTGDQWFDESQFESYRKLGSHIVDSVCRGGVSGSSFHLDDVELDKFLEQATTRSR